MNLIKKLLSKQYLSTLVFCVLALVGFKSFAVSNQELMDRLDDIESAQQQREMNRLMDEYTRVMTQPLPYVPPQSNNSQPYVPKQSKPNLPTSDCDMHLLEKLAKWIVNNESKKGSSDFQVVADAYKSMRKICKLN